MGAHHLSALLCLVYLAKLYIEQGAKAFIVYANFEEQIRPSDDPWMSDAEDSLPVFLLFIYLSLSSDLSNF